MNVCRGIVIAVAFLSLAACKDDEGGTAPIAPLPTAAPTPTTPATPTGTTDLKTDSPVAPSKMGIEARVKSELDNRADGITGSPLSAAGATASLQGPTGWTSAKSGDFTVSTSADKKAQLAVGAVGAEGASGKLPAAISALGLSSCEWGAAETVTVGKTKLASSAADGVCMRGTVQVRTAYVAPNAEKLLVVGAWEQGGDSAGVFGAMRSIAKASGGDPSGIAACCAALRGNAKSAPPEQVALLLGAAGVCDTLRNDPAGKAALAQVRGMLAGANVPSTCR